MRTTRTSIRWSRRAMAGLAAVALAISLAACGTGGSDDTDHVEDAGGSEPETPSQAEWDEIVEKAKEEGQLTVFSSAGSSDQYFLEFQEEYPEITVTVERQPTADLVSRLEQELMTNSPAVDVTYHTQTAWFTAKSDEKLLAPLQLSPEVADIYSEVDELGRYYLPVLRNPFLFAYNTTTGQPFSTIDEALDSIGDEKVGLLGHSSPAATFQWYTWAQNYDDFVDRLGELDTTINASTAPLSQSLASGELSYVFPITPGILDPLLAEGAPVDQVVLDEYTTGIQYGAGIVAEAQHPNAAQLFVNWMTNKAGQQFLLEHQSPAAVVTGEGESLAWDDIEPFESSGIEQSTLDEFEQDEWNPVMG